MMTLHDGEVLNDLLRINLDRVGSYERAIGELKQEEDPDLIALFKSFIDDSQVFIAALTAELEKMEQPVATHSTAMGKIYTVWMEIKAYFTGNDRQTILNSCEAVEDAVKRAYESALNEPGLLPDTFVLIKHQSERLQKAHSQVKKLRDA